MKIINKYKLILFKIYFIIAFLIYMIDKKYFINEQNHFLKNKTETVLKIFIMAHKDFKNLRNNSVYSIVVDDKSQLKKKYNLSIIYAKEGKLYNMRRAYCEMSKLYYIYQLYKDGTISSKYIGLNHYRRYFSFNDNIPDIDNILKNYDVILSKPFLYPQGIKKQFCQYHNCSKYEEILEIIKIFKPEYYKTAIKVSSEAKMYCCNIFIMKKNDFLKYCKFIFDILFEFDKRNNFASDEDVLNFTKKLYNNTQKAYTQSRLQGFLAERISNIFFYHNFRRIKMF